ncbi:hypothetical protein [Adhaeribacter terreus]|uniref:Lipoprotein n=1 Tax=Adhaeribacter terreus TaxID=529703 RepID=A0ABW0ED65_9BACT
MKKLLLLSAIACTLFSCEEKRTVEKSVKITRDQNGTTTTTTAEKAEGDTATKPDFETGKVELNIKRTHHFSDPTKPDNFALHLTGPSLLKSTIHFTITDPKGTTIFLDTLTAADLEASMVYEMKTNKPTEQEREAFVKKRLNEFFDDKNFSTPAIAPNDMYDRIYGNEKSWNAIKNDPKSISFNYLIGKENGQRIAYSRLEKKVMHVGNFGG